MAKTRAENEKRAAMAKTRAENEKRAAMAKTRAENEKREVNEKRAAMAKTRAENEQREAMEKTRIENEQREAMEKTRVENEKRDDEWNLMLASYAKNVELATRAELAIIDVRKKQQQQQQQQDHAQAHEEAEEKAERLFHEAMIEKIHQHEHDDDENSQEVQDEQKEEEAVVAKKKRSVDEMLHLQQKISAQWDAFASQRRGVEIKKPALKHLMEHSILDLDEIKSCAKLCNVTRVFQHTGSQFPYNKYGLSSTNETVVNRREPLYFYIIVATAQPKEEAAGEPTCRISAFIRNVSCQPLSGDESDDANDDWERNVDSETESD
jgi:hypothetical protein